MKIIIICLLLIIIIKSWRIEKYPETENELREIWKKHNEEINKKPYKTEDDINQDAVIFYINESAIYHKGWRFDKYIENTIEAAIEKVLGEKYSIKQSCYKSISIKKKD